MNHISFTALAKLLDKPNNNIYYDSITNVTNSVKYEIVDEKTKNSKTYKSENDLYETEIYNKAVHYLDNGKYVNIDNTLIDFGDYYRNNKNSFFINFPKTLKDKAIELDYQDYLMKIYFDDFVRAINSLNKHENFDIYITGSNSKFLSKDINDEFKDRGSEINVRPLSFSEYYPAYKKDKRFALADYNGFDARLILEFDLKGGLPILGHMALLVQDLNEDWHLIEFTGNKKKDAAVKIVRGKDRFEKPQKIWKRLLACFGISGWMSINIEGEFNNSLEYARKNIDKYNGKYNLLTNNCVHFVRNALRCGDAKNDLLDLYFICSTTPSPVVFYTHVSKVSKFKNFYRYSPLIYGGRYL